MTPYERASSKVEGRILACREITSLPPDAAALIFHLEGSVSEFSKLLFPLLANREPPTRRPLTGCSLRHGRPKGLVCGARQYCLFLCVAHGGGGGVCLYRRSSASKLSTPGPTPGVLHLHLRVRNY